MLLLVHRHGTALALAVQLLLFSPGKRPMVSHTLLLLLRLLLPGTPAAVKLLQMRTIMR